MGAKPLGYMHAIMGVHITSFFCTAATFWLVFQTCLPPNWRSEGKQLLKILQKPGVLLL